MPARTLLAVGAGIASALLFGTLMTGSPLAIVIMPFSMLPLFLIGLSGGAVPSIIAAVAATSLVAAMGGLVSAVAYAAAEAVPAVAISGQAVRHRTDRDGRRVWLPVGHLMGYMTGYGALLLVVIFLGFSGFEGGFIGLVERQVTLIFEPMVADGPDAREMLTQFAAQVARLAPGTMAAWWLIITLVSLGIAHSLLRRWGRNLRPTLGLARVETPRWITVALAGGVLLGLLADGTAGLVGWNLVQVLIVPFVFVGLMVLHMLCRGWGPGPIFLGLFYLVLFVRGWPMFVAAALGFAEQWVKLRDKIGGPAPS